VGRVGDGMGTEISMNRNVSIEAALSLEDETRIANGIVRPDLYEKNRMIINREKFLGVEGAYRIRTMCFRSRPIA
jgi:hypothetical protein